MSAPDIKYNAVIIEYIDRSGDDQRVACVSPVLNPLSGRFMSAVSTRPTLPLRTRRINCHMDRLYSFTPVVIGPEEIARLNAHVCSTGTAALPAIMPGDPSEAGSTARSNSVDAALAAAAVPAAATDNTSADAFNAATDHDWQPGRRARVFGPSSPVNGLRVEIVRPLGRFVQVLLLETTPSGSPGAPLMLQHADLRWEFES